MSEESNQYLKDPIEIFKARINDLEKYDPEHKDFSYDYLDDEKLEFYQKILALNRLLLEKVLALQTKH